jgi:hypothetical protein
MGCVAPWDCMMLSETSNLDEATQNVDDALFDIQVPVATSSYGTNDECSNKHSTRGFSGLCGSR